MSFEVKATQVLSYTDTIGANDAISRAANEARLRRKNDALKKMNKSDTATDHGGHTLSSITHAIVKGLGKQVDEEVFDGLDPEQEYHFVYDADVDKIHLMGVDDNIIIMTVTPDEFDAVIAQLKDPAGNMTDYTI